MIPRRLLTTAAGCLALLCGAPASADNAIQFDAFDTGGDLYIECLGEVISYEEHIETAYHEFETPSGTYHLIDSWKFYLTATGTISGRKWFGILTSPGQGNSGGAEVFQYAIRGVIRGVSKDAPSFAWTGSYKVTFNANGDMAVENDSGGFSARCLGKK